VASIRVRLDAVRSSGVRVLFAIESGSRAWGFPSPDSDYDCRFVYARPPRHHLVLEQARDVIEFPIEGEVDVGGWDLRKALLLALAGNAVVVEWARSRIAYEEVEGFRDRFIVVLDKIVDPAKVAKHYLGLAQSTKARLGSFNGDVKLKRVFYLLRPLIALDWMEHHQFSCLPPMNMMDSLAQAKIASDVVAQITELVEVKAKTRELGVGPIPAAIARYCDERYAHHELNMRSETRDQKRRSSDRALAEDFYRDEVERE